MDMGIDSRPEPDPEMEVLRQEQLRLEKQARIMGLKRSILQMKQDIEQKKTGIRNAEKEIDRLTADLEGVKPGASDEGSE